MVMQTKMGAVGTHMAPQCCLGTDPLLIRQPLACLQRDLGLVRAKGLEVQLQHKRVVAVTVCQPVAQAAGEGAGRAGGSGEWARRQDAWAVGMAACTTAHLAGRQD